MRVSVQKECGGCAPELRVTGEEPVKYDRAAGFIGLTGMRGVIHHPFTVSSLPSGLPGIDEERKNIKTPVYIYIYVSAPESDGTSILYIYIYEGFRGVKKSSTFIKYFRRKYLVHVVIIPS